jgi:hypothetical protein
MERAPELCFGALSTVPSMAPNDDLERGWRCPDVSTLPDSGSRDLVESQCTGSFDRDPDAYGIRALNSCRARSNTCSISVRRSQPWNRLRALGRVRHWSLSYLDVAAVVVQHGQPPSAAATTAAAASQQGPSRTASERRERPCPDNPASWASSACSPLVRSAMSLRRCSIMRGSSAIESAQCPEWHQPAILAASSSGTSSRGR